MNEAYLSTVSSVGLVVVACGPLSIQYAVRFALIVVGVVAFALSIQRQRMWIAFTLLISVAYLLFEIAFRRTLIDAQDPKGRGVIAEVRSKPKLVKKHAMHHAIWAGTLVFDCIVSFGYGRFSGPGYLGTALVAACVLVWVHPNFRSKFSEFDANTVAVKHKATIASLIGWRIVSVCGALSNLVTEPFWCYVGFVVASPIVAVVVFKSRAIYFDVSVQIETWVLAMLVFVSTDHPPTDAAPRAVQWIVFASGVAFCVYTALRLGHEYPSRVLV